MLATVGQPSFSGQLLGRSGELGEDGDSGESGLLAESGDSGDSALAGDVTEAVSGAAAEASAVAAAPGDCPGSGSVVDAAGLARRGCAGPVSALSAVVACGEAILARPGLRGWLSPARSPAPHPARVPAAARPHQAGGS